VSRVQRETLLRRAGIYFPQSRMDPGSAAQRSRTALRPGHEILSQPESNAGLRQPSR